MQDQNNIVLFERRTFYFDISIQILKYHSQLEDRTEIEAGKFMDLAQIQGVITHKCAAHTDQRGQTVAGAAEANDWENPKGLRLNFYRHVFLNVGYVIYALAVGKDKALNDPFMNEDKPFTSTKEILARLKGTAAALLNKKHRLLCSPFHTIFSLRHLVY